MLKKKIDELLNTKGKVVLAIDGRCGAGKSTLADILAKEYACNIIHMDDFYLPTAMRTPDRLAQPGGNVHYERFLEEVAPLLTNGRDGIYRIYSCRTGTFTKNGQIYDRPLTIVEGSYSMRPELRHLYDYSIFLDVDSHTQKERLLHRVGAEAFLNFTQKWIPMEESYFSFYNIPAVCDQIIRLTDKISL